MSSRAIQALRGRAGALPEIPPTVSEDGDESSEEENDEVTVSKRKPAFAFMLEDEDEDDEEESSDDESLPRSGKSGDAGAGPDEGEDDGPEKEKEAKKKLPAGAKREEAEKAEEEVEEEEDLDALLDEFREKDDNINSEDDADDQPDHACGGNNQRPSCPFDILLDNLDARDLDYEYSMRTSLLNDATGGEAPSSSAKRTRKAPLFGAARDGWIRPPRLVGGGLGMTTYDRDPRLLPWPYNTDVTTTSLSLSQWCTFVHSDSYQRDCNDYATVIRQSGDLNALVLFVAHHPYVTTALLQLSTVLFQTNHSAEGRAMLHRCLWIYESAALVSFVSNLQQQQQYGNDKKKGGGGVFLMDHEQPENQPFFDALVRLVQASHMAGLSRTSLATARLLLSLDPLRDPTNMLLILDKHALTVSRGSSKSVAEEVKLLQWLVDLVDGSEGVAAASSALAICYRDESSGQTYRCSLRELPNWSYSYALALFWLHQHLQQQEEESTDGSNGTGADDIKGKADAAIQAAMSRYPLVVDLLLQHLEADTTGRSFRRDWVSVLDFARDRGRLLAREWHSQKKNDTVVLSATMQACDLVIQIFVQQNSSLWGQDDVQQWMYDNLKDLSQSCLLHRRSWRRRSTTTTVESQPRPHAVRWRGSRRLRQQNPDFASGSGAAGSRPRGARHGHEPQSPSPRSAAAAWATTTTTR